MMRSLILFGFVVMNVGCSDLRNKPLAEPVTQTCARQTGFSIPAFASGSFEREKMIRQVTHGLLARWHSDFVDETRSLLRILESEGRGDGAMNAQEAWRRAARVWARIQAAEFGPSKEDGGLLSGLISSWPVTNFCGVDRLVAGQAVDQDWPSDPGPAVRGLQALEYVLFASVDTVTCPRRAAPEVAAWMELSADERASSRRKVALKLAEHLVESARALDRRWSPQGGAYGELMLNSCVASDVRSAVNQLSDSLFHVEILKDRKLAIPMGLSTSCAASVCPEAVESPTADFGLSLVVAHLEGLEMIFHGGPAPAPEDWEESFTRAPFGFADFLASLGRPEVALRIAQEIRQAVTRARALEGRGEGFASQLRSMDEDRRLEFVQLFESVRTLGRSLKSDFLGVLDLRPPRLVEGDND